MALQRPSHFTETEALEPRTQGLLRTVPLPESFDDHIAMTRLTFAAVGKTRLFDLTSCRPPPKPWPSGRVQHLPTASDSLLLRLQRSVVYFPRVAPSSLSARNGPRSADVKSIFWKPIPSAHISETTTPWIVVAVHPKRPPFSRRPSLLFPLSSGAAGSVAAGFAQTPPCVRMHASRPPVRVSGPPPQVVFETVALALRRRHHGPWAWRLQARSGFRNHLEMPRNAPSALLENRCLGGAEPLPDDVHRGHYLTTHQRVQGFCQRSQFSFGGHWKSRPCLRQQRTVEAAHRQAPHIRSCFQFSGGLSVPDLAGERDDGGCCERPKMLPRHLANTRFVSHPQFCTAFFACTVPRRSNFQRTRHVGVRNDAGAGASAASLHPPAKQLCNPSSSPSPPTTATAKFWGHDLHQRAEQLPSRATSRPRPRRAHPLPDVSLLELHRDATGPHPRKPSRSRPFLAVWKDAFPGPTDSEFAHLSTQLDG